MPPNYWTNRINTLATRIRRGGWRVTFRVCGLSKYGHCDYVNREIVIDESSTARQAFMTLCHEAGHRKAFLNSRCKTYRQFEKRYPRSSYRELQAITLGWDYLIQYDKSITQRQWLCAHRKELLHAAKGTL